MTFQATIALLATCPVCGLTRVRRTVNARIDGSFDRGHGITADLEPLDPEYHCTCPDNPAALLADDPARVTVRNLYAGNRKECSRCHEILPLEECFYPGRRGGKVYFSSWCKACTRAHRRNKSKRKREYART